MNNYKYEPIGVYDVVISTEGWAIMHVADHEIHGHYANLPDAMSARDQLNAVAFEKEHARVSRVHAVTTIGGRA